MPTSPDVMTSAQVAEIFHTTRQTIHRWVQDGRLVPLSLPGRNLKFRRSDVEAMLEPTEATA